MLKTKQNIFHYCQPESGKILNSKTTKRSSGEKINARLENTSEEKYIKREIKMIKTTENGKRKEGRGKTSRI